MLHAWHNCLASVVVLVILAALVENRSYNNGLIFYDPQTRNAFLPPTVSVSRGRSLASVKYSAKGSIWSTFGKPCDCSGAVCGCCAGIKVKQYNFDQKMCANVTFMHQQDEAILDIFLNEKPSSRFGISARNPAPFCIPVMLSIPMAMCVQMSDIAVQGNSLNMCMDFVVRLATTDLFEMHFQCMRMGLGGVQYVDKNGQAVIPPAGASNTDHEDGKEEGEDSEYFDEYPESENEIESTENKVGHDKYTGPSDSAELVAQASNKIVLTTEAETTVVASGDGVGNEVGDGDITSGDDASGDDSSGDDDDAGYDDRDNDVDSSDGDDDDANDSDNDVAANNATTSAAVAPALALTSEAPNEIMDDHVTAASMSALDVNDATNILDATVAPTTTTTMATPATIPVTTATTTTAPTAAANVDSAAADEYEDETTTVGDVSADDNENEDEDDANKVGDEVEYDYENEDEYDGTTDEEAVEEEEASTFAVAPESTVNTTTVTTDSLLQPDDEITANNVAGNSVKVAATVATTSMPKSIKFHYRRAYG